MMRQGIGAVAVVVVPVHIVKEAPDMVAQSILQDEERLAAAMPMGGRLLEHEPQPAAIDRRLPPRGFCENAGQIGFIRTVQDAAGHMGHALIGQDAQPGQIVLKMSKLALVLKHVAEDPAGSVTTGAGSIIGRSIAYPLILVKVLSPGQGYHGGFGRANHNCRVIELISIYGILGL